MKMVCRDNAECQNWEKRDIMVILEFFLNDNKTKWNSDLLHLKKEKRKRVEEIQKRKWRF